ncbi:hypothetical protein [Streptomyces cupreus]|uniref:Uncharacterized protein n=1 Tax=Streptomyces cupreus TaxID=2759956 RepID=A0A7X1M812_9ACTN|nr:hypothetical protein [Streptomyces cupreus]MBC2901088.1 hypothetical protein [Streptomyces cupreus]
MTQQPLPGDPAALRLNYHFGHGLSGDTHEETVERWQVDIRHGGDTHDAASPIHCGASVGHMVFYRIRLTQRMNAYWAMEAESEELYELAQALLDPSTGYFTEEVDQLLAYVGMDLLIMDRVVLNREWRGFGLGPMLAAEAIDRIGLGCRAVACSPGVSEPDPDWRPDQEEWDRVTGRIRAAWKRAGFTGYRDSSYLLGPASPETESARDALRTGFQDLCLRWRAERTDALDLLQQDAEYLSAGGHQ